MSATRYGAATALHQVTPGATAYRTSTRRLYGRALVVLLESGEVDGDHEAARRLIASRCVPLLVIPSNRALPPSLALGAAEAASDLRASVAAAWIREASHRAEVLPVGVVSVEPVEVAA